jgi:hypothetical protein
MAADKHADKPKREVGDALGMVETRGLIGGPRSGRRDVQDGKCRVRRLARVDAGS